MPLDLSLVTGMAQIPRLYAVYKHSGEIEDFEHMLRNIFAPLFEVTRDPQSNVPLATFLDTVRRTSSPPTSTYPSHPPVPYLTPYGRCLA